VTPVTELLRVLKVPVHYSMVAFVLLQGEGLHPQQHANVDGEWHHARLHLVDPLLVKGIELLFSSTVRHEWRVRYERLPWQQVCHSGAEGIP
jgi:hypothetical protein